MARLKVINGGAAKSGAAAARAPLRLAAAEEERVCVFIDGDNLPEVLDLAELALAGEAMRAVQCAGQGVAADLSIGPIFKRGGELVRVVERSGISAGVWRGPASRVIEPVDEHSLAEKITQVAHVYVRGRRGYRRENFPLRYARHLIARRSYPGLPELTARQAGPTIDRRGTVYREPGLDVATGILFDFEPEAFRAILDEVCNDDAIDAAMVLRELLAGFPFATPVDESVAIAALLTAIVRPMVANVPLFLITAPAAGSGKTHLTRVIGRLATGCDPAVMTYVDDRDELRKRLLAVLLEGDPIVTIDNVDGDLAGAELCAVLTSTSYKDRQLGASQMVTVRNAALFLANGNNVAVRGDLGRRTLHCRLDPQVERPAEREFAFDPAQLVEESRGELVAACLTIIKAFQRRRDYTPCPRPFGSFEEWSELVRRPLLWLEFPDPCDSVAVMERVDPEREVLVRLLACWHAQLGPQALTGAELVRRAEHLAKPTKFMDGGGAPEPATELLDTIREIAERNGEVSPRVLGKFLARNAGRIEQGRRIERGVSAYSGITWKLVTVARTGEVANDDAPPHVGHRP